MKSRILAVGGVNMNFNAKMSEMPAAGQMRIDRSGSYSFTVGGGGTVAATAFSKLGGDCVLCARVGNDSNGEKCVQQLKRFGVDTRFVTYDKYSETGLAALCRVADEKQRCVVYPGANDSLCPSDVEEAFVSRPDAAYLRFDVPDDAIIAASKCACEQGIPVFADAFSVRNDFSFDKLEKLEALILGEDAVQACTDVFPNNAENCLRAAVKLGAMVKAKYYILKLGLRGAYVYDGRYSSLITSPEAKATDAPYATDSFGAALTFHYLCSKDIFESCKFANLAHLLVSTHQGETVFPTLDELENYAKEINYEV